MEQFCFSTVIRMRNIDYPAIRGFLLFMKFEVRTPWPMRRIGARTPIYIKIYGSERETPSTKLIRFIQTKHCQNLTIKLHF